MLRSSSAISSTRQRPVLTAPPGSPRSSSTLVACGQTGPRSSLAHSVAWNAGRWTQAHYLKQWGGTLSLGRYEALLPAFNAAMVAAGITTPLRAAHWCSHPRHESGGSWMEESASGAAPGGGGGGGDGWLGGYVAGASGGCGQVWICFRSYWGHGKTPCRLVAAPSHPNYRKAHKAATPAKPRRSGGKSPSDRPNPQPRPHTAPGAFAHRG